MYINCLCEDGWGIYCSGLGLFVLGLLGFFSLSQSIGEAGHVLDVLLNIL